MANGDSRGETRDMIPGRIRRDPISWPHAPPSPRRRPRPAASGHPAGRAGAPIFFEGGDEEVYRDLLARETRRRAVEVWAWCLMADQVA